MKISFRIILLIAISLISLTACKKHKTLVEIGNEQQIMYVGNFDEPADVDPHTVSGIPEYHLEMAIFEGLTAKDPKTLAAIPAAADSWSISDDGTVYIFHIRDTARWSDGDKLTAYDFEYSWHRALMPAIACEMVSDFFAIKNAEDFYNGKITDFKEVGIKALDESHLKVVLNNPVSYFLVGLDNFDFYPVQKKTIEKFNAFDDRATRWTRAENFVGNGAFTIKEWIPSVVFTVKRNPYYWDAANVKLNEIHFYPTNNLLQEEKMFRVGQLHKTEFLPSSKVDAYKNSPEYINFDYYGVYFYSLNIKVKPLDDVRVRKALAYSIDRELLTKNVLRGGQTPAFHYTPDDPYGYKASANMVYDVSLAKKLLADAGFPDGKGFPSLRLVYNTNSDHLKVALAVQQMWKKNLGINITLQNFEWKVYLSEREQKNFDIIRRADIGDVLDPATFLKSLKSSDSQNETNWGSARYDELIESATKQKDNIERFKYFQEADQILVDEVPLIPIYFYKTNNLLSPSVKGYYNNIMDYHPYKYVYLDASAK